MTELLRYPFTEQGLSEALEALGTTPQAVATNLSAMGFTGKVNEPLCCPVANYPRASVTSADSACVAKDESMTLYAEVESPAHLGELVGGRLPQPVDAFIAQFDARLFPDLIDEGGF